MQVLDKGARNVEILKQNEGSPLPVEEQVAIIYCGSTGIISGIPTNKVKEFENNFLELMRNKHKAYGCTDELVSWIVKNIPRAETAVTFLSTPVKLGVERYLVSGFDCTFVQG